MAKLITDYPVERDALLYVMCENCKPKGWRVELLVEKLSSKLEEKVMLCSCCNGLLRDACVCDGTLMCQVCIPEDDTAWQPVVMNREIVDEKMISCPLKCRGCVWSDTVSAAVQHLETCLYLPEVCPLGCVSLEGEKGEVVRMERRHIPEHMKDSCPLREIVCEFCDGKVKASEMNPHLEDCMEFPLHCPNGCSREGEDGVREVKRKDIPVHLDNNCPLQKVQCPYWDHGCREEIERRHTDTHEREFLHIHFKLSMTEMEQKHNKSTQRLQHELDVAQNQISKLRNELNAATNKIATLTTALPSHIPTGRLEWKIEGVRQKIRNKEETYSDPFYVGLYKCQGSIYWDCDSAGNVGIFICIMKGDYDDVLHWPIRYKYTFNLINQINSEYNSVISFEIDKGDFARFHESFKKPSSYKNDDYGRRSFISNTQILQENYCKQDSITLRITVELFSSF